MQHMPIRKTEKQPGMSLLESLIAMVILAGALLSLAHMESSFGKQYLDRRLHSALQDVAVSEISRCKIGAAANTSQTYLGYAITISRTGGNCQPASATCQDIVVSTTGNNRSFSLTTKVCNF
jgi:prepilin-type N-terminal cleavage/methylation domain-containing protein